MKKIFITVYGTNDEHRGVGTATIRWGEKVKTIGTVSAVANSAEMAVRATRKALERLNSKNPNTPFDITIVSSNEFITSSISDWMPNWIEKGWIKSDGEEPKFKDEWMQISRELAIHTVSTAKPGDIDTHNDLPKTTQEARRKLKSLGGADGR